MATFYLPSSTTGYATDNSKVLYRLVITENYTTTDGKRLRVRLYAYRSDSGYETDGKGTAKIYIDGSLKHTKSFAMGDYPIDSSGVYIVDTYISIAANASSVKVSAILSIPNTSAGTSDNQGGTITLTKYTITYNANGGSGAPSSQTGAFNANVKLSTTVPIKSGYKFLGWNTSSTATTAAYTAGGTYTITGNVTLYAIWSNAITYTITYNANGGSGAPSSQTGASGTTVALSSAIPTRTNYIFVGWATSSSATSPSYHAGSLYAISANVTLYAVWLENRYTIHYNANRGTGAPASQIKMATTALTLSSTIPTRTKHTFLGWSTSPTATSATYSAGGNYTANECVILYAVWSIGDDSTYIFKDGHIECVNFIETDDSAAFAPQNTYAVSLAEVTSQQFYVKTDGTMCAYTFNEIQFR